MSHPNYAGNIIVVLANLPNFLRKPILEKRMSEFFTMSDDEKKEIINNALEAGPTIPFLNFSILFKTWLEILSTFSEEHRKELFLCYMKEISRSPQKLIVFNLDGIFEIFLSLDNEKRKILSQTIKDIIDNLDALEKKRVLLIIPDNAKKEIGI